MVLVANAVNFIGLLAINRFAYGVGADLHTLLFDEYLHRDYAFHTRTHSSILISNIVHEVGRVATGVVQSVLMLLSSLVTCTLIAVSLLHLQPVPGAVRRGTAGRHTPDQLCAGTRPSDPQWNSRARSSAQQRTRTLTESFGAIREVLVAGRQEFFSRRFAEQCRQLARAIVHTQALTLAPRFVAESAVAATLIGAALWLTLAQGSSHWAARLSFLALAAYRLLPSLQQAFVALARLRLDRVAFQRVASDLDRQSRLGVPRLPFRRSRGGAAGRELHRVARCDRALSGARSTCSRSRCRCESPLARWSALPVPTVPGNRRCSICWWGCASPTSGVVAVDGEPLDERTRDSWQTTIAYLPQQVALLDASVIENIALGASRFRGSGKTEGGCSARRPRLAGGHAPGGYDYRLGERGVQLSGGQRQRIGLARALYRRPSLLVLDEPTAALDPGTEREVMEMLIRLRGRCTLARRHPSRGEPSTLRSCGHSWSKEGKWSADDASAECAAREARWPRSIRRTRAGLAPATLSRARCDSRGRGRRCPLAGTGSRIVRIATASSISVDAHPGTLAAACGSRALAADAQATKRTTDFGCRRPGANARWRKLCPRLTGTRQCARFHFAAATRAYVARYDLMEFAAYTLAARSGGLVPLHAACIGRAGRGALVLGDSGAGKSTLCVRAVAAGFDFLAEDAGVHHARQTCARRACQPSCTCAVTHGPDFTVCAEDRPSCVRRSFNDAVACASSSSTCVLGPIDIAPALYVWSMWSYCASSARAFPGRAEARSSTAASRADANTAVRRRSPGLVSVSAPDARACLRTSCVVAHTRMTR